jgi:hypothetical protein
VTPAENYLEAERLLGVAEDEQDTAEAAVIVAMAQVRATLAQAGATFLHGQGGVYPTPHDAFVDAIFPTPGPEAPPDTSWVKTEPLSGKSTRQRVRRGI